MGPSLCILLLSRIFIPEAVFGSTANIRDIHGPIPPSGIPPFIVTASLILLGVAAVWGFRRKKVMTAELIAVEREPDTPSDLLVTLENRYRSGEITASLFFEKLSGLVRTRLADLNGSDPSHLTSQELLALAGKHLQIEIIQQAAGILMLCDAVRFGAVQTDAAAIDRVLQAAADIMNIRSGKAS